MTQSTQQQATVTIPQAVLQKILTDLDKLSAKNLELEDRVTGLAQTAIQGQETASYLRDQIDYLRDENLKTKKELKYVRENETIEGKLKKAEDAFKEVFGEVVDFVEELPWASIACHAGAVAAPLAGGALSVVFPPAAPILVPATLAATGGLELAALNEMDKHKMRQFVESNRQRGIEIIPCNDPERIAASRADAREYEPRLFNHSDR